MADADSLHSNPIPTADSGAQPAPDTTESAPAAQAELDPLAALEQRGHTGANWFYWIAALSLVNTAILLSGGDRQFVIGLGVTQVVNALAVAGAQAAPDIATVIKIAAVLVSVGIAAFVALFGWLANRRYSAAFIIGMGLYLCDGVLYLLIEDWMSVAFHAYALYGLWHGLSAFRQLNQLEAQAGWEQAAA